MSIKDLVLNNRSYRRFNGDGKISRDELVELVELARTSASAANKQPLKFMISNEKEKNDMIFPKIAWAGYLPDWDGPVEKERPTGYIIILGDTSISTNFFVDHGIAAQSILLGATEMGLGGCMIAAFNKDDLKKDLSIPDHLDPLLIIALGEPVESVVIEPIRNDDVKYYRDERGVHHVPKRQMEEILLE
jgi:nitroreductase